LDTGTNSKKVSEVLRQCHDKSWKFGRSDFQIARGGASSYVASTLTALVLLPYYIEHATHLNPDKERLLDFLKKARFMRKVKTSIIRLSKKSILSLMDESITSTGPVHFRPHYHILLFSNSKKVSEVLRQCHDKKPIILNRNIFLQFTVKRYRTLNLREEYMTQLLWICTTIFGYRNKRMVFIA
jgi:hypothetical protein